MGHYRNDFNGSPKASSSSLESDLTPPIAYSLEDSAQASNSSGEGAIIAFIVGVVISTMAMAAIIHAIIVWRKKVSSSIAASAPIAPSSEHVAITVKLDFPVILDSQVKNATMERFLSNIAREKPIRFSPEQLEGFTYSFSKILGSGGCGVVFKGEFPNGVPVAVKVLTNHSNKKSVEAQFMAEVSTIGRTYHVNLVRLYGFCFDPSVVALVYEFMENGPLSRIFFDESLEIEWEKLHEIAIETGKGLAYLHEECQQRIVHYDIKPENILLDENLSAKVADFGLAKLCNRDTSHVTTSGFRGTLGYCAPEVFYRNYPITYKCDIYSFGILLFEIIGRRRHFDDSVQESHQWLPRWTWDAYKNNELPVMLSLCGISEKDRAKAERMASVALMCIQHSPYARPVMSDVVKILEGSMDITQQPQNPFAYLESTGHRVAWHPGSSGDDFSKSASSRNTFGQSHFRTMNGRHEIELASQ